MIEAQIAFAEVHLVNNTTFEKKICKHDSFLYIFTVHMNVARLILRKSIDMLLNATSVVGHTINAFATKILPQ